MTTLERIARELPALADLVDREISLRELARTQELNPNLRESADRLFRAADHTRRARIARLESCGLL